MAPRIERSTSDHLLRSERGRSGCASKPPYRIRNEDGDDENVEFAIMLATLLIVAAATGAFLVSPIVSEMQVREAASLWLLSGSLAHRNAGGRSRPPDQILSKPSGDPYESERQRITISLTIGRKRRGNQMNQALRRYLHLVRSLVYSVVVMLVNPAAGKEPPEPLHRIGVLAWSPCDIPLYLRHQGEFGLFIGGLIDLGYKPDETVMIACRSAGRRYDRLIAAADELVRLPVDVIVAGTQPAGIAAHEGTTTVPIVSVLSGDPVAAGLAHSLARPGGNVTGVSYYATELTAKRLELLREMIPTATTIGVLANPDCGAVTGCAGVAGLPFEADTRRAASEMGISLSVQQVNDATNLESAFARMKAEGAQAVFVLPDLMFASEARRIAELAIANRLPTMAWGSGFTRVGCLMAYSADYETIQTRLAFFVDRVFKGASPGDLPIEQPTTFKLSINLKTAKALGLEPPQNLLILADVVIE
jgi:putative tryptophan/tyrosine transport system substrate-binding protein